MRIYKCQNNMLSMLFVLSPQIAVLVIANNDNDDDDDNAGAVNSSQVTQNS